MPLINIKEQKRALRAKYKKVRAGMDSAKKESIDLCLCSKLLNLEEYQNCSTVFAYVSTALEVNTQKILAACLKDGKKLALPKCMSADGLMNFYYVSSLEELKKGMYSVYEPEGSKNTTANCFDNALCIVPGLCFDGMGYRLGFGKGYYDRFLQNFNSTTVGLCYSRCVCPQLPKGKFDRPVDILITEKYTNYTHNVFSEG